MHLVEAGCPVEVSATYGNGVLLPLDTKLIQCACDLCEVPAHAVLASVILVA